MSKSSDDKFTSGLFSKYRQMMFKIAFGILHNQSDAEDVVQSAFLWIINNLDKISQMPCNKRACYFANITEHISIDLLRKQKQYPTEDIVELYDLSSDCSVEEEALSKLTVNEIKTALEDFSDRDYNLLYLYLFDGKSPKEIGKFMGISENNIRVYIQRARKRFIKILKKRGVIDDV